MNSLIYYLWGVGVDGSITNIYRRTYINRYKYVLDEEEETEHGLVLFLWGFKSI